MRRNILFLPFLMLFACSTKIKDDHPEHFERFFKQLDTASLRTYPSALDSLDAAIHHLPAGTGDKARYYRIKAGYYRNKEDYEQTFIYLDSLEKTVKSRIKEERFRGLQWQQLFIKSECYIALKNYDAAMKCLLEAKASDKDEVRARLGIEPKIADLLYKQGRFRLAAQHYIELFKLEKKYIFSKRAIFQNGQRYLDNAGLCYAEIGMYDSAMYYYNATLDYLKVFKAAIPEQSEFIDLARAVVYGNIAKIEALHNNFEKAEELSIASINGTRKADPGFTLTTQLQLANLYISWNKPDKAQAILQEVDTLYGFSKRGRLEDKRMEWNLAMRTLAEKMGSLKTAYAYGNEYISIRDSLDLIRKRDISRDMGKEFENLEQRAINEKLEATNREKSFQFIIAVLTAILAAAIGLFVWYNLRRSSKHVKELEKLNAQVQEKNDDLMQAFTSLEESHAENTRMTRMVAHDLKNPIGGIRTLVYSLMAKTPTEELRKMLELIYSTCNNSINTINELLKDKGSLATINKEMVDLRRLMEYCVELLQTKSEEKRQEIHFMTGERIYIHANREKIWRVMSNLISNAIKFSPENSTIDIKLEKKTQSAILSVKDRGIGIPEELRDKIFTRTPEISRTGTAGEESHGLGLSITQQIVAEHHGKIWFESEEHKGCTFYVELPLN